MVKRVVYLELAVHDLSSIYKYISQDSIKYARLEVQKIKAFAESLKYHPLKGKFFKTIKNEEIRSVVFKRYIIFYSIADIQINILSITTPA
jgi:toxin ParE1/3/4